MAAKAEASFAYRNARKAFIAACERAHGDSIARVHPSAVAPDGKPLFIDSVALGPREAAKGLLVITGSNGKAGLLGSRILADLLDNRIMALPQTRLVLVHALNPFGFAWAKQQNEDGLRLDDPAAAGSWSLLMLAAIATEDLAKTRILRVLDVDQGRREEVADARNGGVVRALKKLRPELDLVAARLTLPMSDAPVLARGAVLTALAIL